MQGSFNICIISSRCLERQLTHSNTYLDSLLNGIICLKIICNVGQIMCAYFEAYIVISTNRQVLLPIK